MIATTAHLFTARVRDAALAGVGMDPGSARPLEGFCSQVFRGTAGGAPAILKVSHSSWVSRPALESELEFAAHLADAGAPVCAPRSRPADLVAVGDGAGGEFYAYLYAAVEGEGYDAATRGPAAFRAAGDALGRLHRAARAFDYRAHPARPAFTDRDFVDFERILPPTETETRRCFRGVVDALRAVPRDDAVYGMTHGDAHDGNVLLTPEAGAVWIDLADVEPGFYLNDLAVFIDSVCDREGLETREWVALVFEHVYRGYREHARVPPEMWAYMPLFFRFRWVMNHCVFQLARGPRIAAEPALRAKRDRRIAMYRDGFSRYDYLYRFDFAAAAAAVDAAIDAGAGA